MRPPFQDRDIVCQVHGEAVTSTILRAMKKARVTGLLNPQDNPKYCGRAASGRDGVCAGWIPTHQSRANHCDVLSFRPTCLAPICLFEGRHLCRALPMMMTAAGHHSACEIFIMGCRCGGSAGHCDGAGRPRCCPHATDVCAATKRTGRLIWARVIAVENDEFKRHGNGWAAYAKQMSPEYQKLQAELTRHQHRQSQDLLSRTALNSRAIAADPCDKKMIDTMRRISVLMLARSERTARQCRRR